MTTTDHHEVARLQNLWLCSKQSEDVNVQYHAAPRKVLKTQLPFHVGAWAVRRQQLALPAFCGSLSCAELCMGTTKLGACLPRPASSFGNRVTASNIHGDFVKATQSTLRAFYPRHVNFAKFLASWLRPRGGTCGLPRSGRRSPASGLCSQPSGPPGNRCT